MNTPLHTLFNRNLSVPADYDLRDHKNIEVVDQIDPYRLMDGLLRTHIYRPRLSNPPGTHEEEIDKAPAGMQRLYESAATDMRRVGADPDQYHMYLLYHFGMVQPMEALREGFWHFDLIRLLRTKSENDAMPVALGYATSSDLPSLYLTQLVSDKALPARLTVNAKDRHDSLGAKALLEGHFFQPYPGEVVRYDTLTLHRGSANPYEDPVPRAFMHIAFSPVA